MIRKNNAFTMIEMIMVLFIVSLIFYVMAFNMKPVLNDMNEKEDITIITNGFLILQNLSIVNKKESSLVIKDGYIEFFLGENSIFKNDINGEVITNFPNDTIKITDEGNLYQGGTISTEDNSIVFHLGSGNYEVK